MMVNIFYTIGYDDGVMDHRQLLLTKHDDSQVSDQNYFMNMFLAVTME